MIIDNRYKVKEQIGSGGMGIVYKVKDIATNNIYALKQLPTEVSVSNPLERFKREIASMASLNHKNIVAICDYKFSDDNYYIVQEYVKGSNLASILYDRGSVSDQEAVDYMKQIASALSYIHKKGILHKDLKPANIIVTPAGTIKVCDFGLSQSKEIELTLTGENKIVGSRYYTAPERIVKQKQTIKSEIFSFGVIAYELLIGKRPFDSKKEKNDEKEVDIQNQIRFSPLPDMNTFLSKGIPQALENVIIKCTAKRPVERYNDFQEIIEDLNTVFDIQREDEQRIKVTQKFRHDINIMPETSDQKLTFNLPKNIIIFVAIFFILLIGVFVYVV